MNTAELLKAIAENTKATNDLLRTSKGTRPKVVPLNKSQGFSRRRREDASSVATSERRDIASSYSNRATLFDSHVHARASLMFTRAREYQILHNRATVTASSQRLA
jgi:hypothetical protein